jgi:hypothetical protein
MPHSASFLSAANGAFDVLLLENGSSLAHLLHPPAAEYHFTAEMTASMGAVLVAPCGLDIRWMLPLEQWCTDTTMLTPNGQSISQFCVTRAGQ